MLPDSSAARIGVLLSSWGQVPSDPLLSEHTLLNLESGSGQVWTVGDPITALLTLVPQSTGRGGLVEVAGRDVGAMGQAWQVHRDEVLASAAGSGYHPVVALDRHGVFEGPAIPGAVARLEMDLAGIAATDPGDHLTPDDIEAVLDLIGKAFSGHPENEWSRPDLEARLSQGWFDIEGFLVERSGGGISGLCWTKVHPDGVGEIYLLAVDPDSRGTGLGSDLVARGLSYLRVRRGADRAIVYTSTDNRAALKVYETLGFAVGSVTRRIAIA